MNYTTVAASTDLVSYIEHTRPLQSKQYLMWEMFKKKDYNYFKITVSPCRRTTDVSSVQFLFDYFIIIIIFLTSTFYAKWNSSRSPSEQCPKLDRLNGQANYNDARAAKADSPRDDTHTRMHERTYIISNGFTDLIIILSIAIIIIVLRAFLYFLFHSFIVIIFLFNLIKNDNIISVVTRRRIHFRPGRFARGEHIPFVITPATESGHKSIYVYQYIII